jgi:chitinase
VILQLRILGFAGALMACSSSVSLMPQPAPPIIITAGGTYSGFWESQDSDVPTVRIRTTEPVIIENALIRGRGNLIHSEVSGVRLTVRNTLGVGLTPSRSDARVGRFLNLENISSALIENNTLEQTAGMYFAGLNPARAASDTIRVLRNRAKNIDGRRPNGTRELVQFVQFNGVRGLAGVEIAWNEVINEPGNSAVEDNINLFKSSGTASSPILIHNNYLQGSYLPDPTMSGHTGGGIMLGDGQPESFEAASAHAKAYRNQVVNATHYGIAIVHGHDLEFFENRIINSGLLPDGRRQGSANVGSYLVNGEDNDALNTPTFYNNSAHHNTIGYVAWWVPGDVKRNDTWFRTCSTELCHSNQALAGPITPQTEQAELELWREKLRSNNIVIGAQ